MTIKVEQEVLLRVLEPPPSRYSLDSTIQAEDGFMLVDFRKPLRHDLCSVEKIREDAYDDDDSIFTVSTASLSDSDSVIERRVSFADDLVTEEWTRPFTPKDEISTLFYSSEETSRFRQEYRLERKLLNDLSLDPQSSDDLLSSVTALSSSSPLSSSAPLSAPRHRISRVVVLHKDKLETFFDDERDGERPEDPREPSPPPSEGAPAPSSGASPSLSANFFDNDSFWSGSITWY